MITPIFEMSTAQTIIHDSSFHKDNHNGEALLIKILEYIMQTKLVTVKCMDLYTR